MNKQINLKFNMSYLKTLAKEKFIRMSKDENLWDQIEDKLQDDFKPVCIYSIYDGLKREDSKLFIDDYTLTSSVFNSIPTEILNECAVFIISVGGSEKAQGILDEALFHMVKISFIEALRDLLRQELQEEHLVGSYFSPGIGDMDIKEIPTFAKLVDFNQAGVTVNDSYMMTPEKSLAGMYMFFSESHPESHNSCDTCMSRGYGCNLCSQGENK